MSNHLKPFIRCMGLFIILIFISLPVYSQPYSAFIHLLLSTPEGEFQNNVDNVGFGIGMGLGIHLKNSPVMLGAQLQVNQYGSEMQRVPFSKTIPDVFVTVETANQILLFHGLLRLQPPRGIFRPYLDGLMGLSYFSTSTTIRDETNSGNLSQIASSIDSEDTVLSYGGGGGLMFSIYQDSRNTLLFDFGVRMLNGGEATYLKKGSIVRNRGGKVGIDPLRSQTDMLLYHAGISYMF